MEVFTAGKKFAELEQQKERWSLSAENSRFREALQEIADDADSAYEDGWCGDLAKDALERVSTGQDCSQNGNEDTQSGQEDTQNGNEPDDTQQEPELPPFKKLGRITGKCRAVKKLDLPEGLDDEPV